jgi:hypothetical protein
MRHGGYVAFGARDRKWRATARSFMHLQNVNDVAIDDAIRWCSRPGEP